MLILAATPPLVAMPEVESRELIAADLRVLISQIESSMRRTATAMDQEHRSDPESSADVFVLDDVTPRYARAIAALDACRAGLGHALECLSEASGTL
ncbi:MULTISPECIES: hypothetical protein [Bradyrhizobium]|uniref:Uncharacterized protein n=1 Tax=Bradyrhizobium canariense TaxID=255045 RepID=A0A1X3HBL1_9BRAD|nr:MULTISPECIES: hypothetical protein [Bradyrhizobium]OSI70757.1 hypothetical protein BSZ21_10505 [Bradyrhizobium canariense]OSI72328.1 hypothetical protein BSZ22_08510 [Bradyrhizobium canariense]OSI81021.1 hypothetical protein BSZ23_08225 [Bradyrhizobium canariense]OSI94232.1 hypothetical protein BSZ25_07155 [Bradyrhizobium canariense]OSI94718.1 hypothetical protein BSZ24_09265 [Bradyrhizobium canariense]